MAFTNGYTFFRTITFDHTKVSGSSDLTSFPVLISGTYPSLATVANGGFVTNSSGFDIRFEGIDGTKLDWELESYTAATGAIIGWVRIPTLAANTAGHGDTTICMYFGNSTITTNIEQNKTGVWDTATKGVWHLPDGTTLTAQDSTTNANHGTLVNGPTAVTGQIDGGGGFASGSFQHIDVTDASSLAFGTGAFTASCWVKYTTVSPNSRALVSKDDYNGSTYKGWLINTNASSKVSFETRRSTSGLDTVVGGTTTVIAGTWYHVAAVRDGTSAATLRLYVNGAQEGSGVEAGSTDITNTEKLHIGALSSSAPQYMNGVLDEVRVAATNRSADWILTEYNTANAPSTFYTVGNLQGHAPSVFNNYQFVNVGNGMSTGERIR